MYHREDDDICRKMVVELNKVGIGTDINNGEIFYNGKCPLDLKCNALYLLRHAETYGTKNNEFMSDRSSNSKLTDMGIQKLTEVIGQIKDLKFDYILYSSIPRVKETSDIIKRQLYMDVCFQEISWMMGIDNAGWENKGKSELQGENIEDFYQREVLHNIFAKSSKGSCWGKVLCCCIQLIHFINSGYMGKRVLLVSQGSIFMGLQVVLHKEEKPWEKYDTDSFFSLQQNRPSNYGTIQCVYENGLKQ